MPATDAADRNYAGNTGGQFVKYLIAFLLFAGSSSAATVVRIACGGSGGTDPAGNVWAPDGNFTGGARWTAANQPALAAQPVPYQSLRYAAPPGALFAYTIPVPAGNYVLTLKFIEPNKAGPLQRRFSVAVNGTPVITDLDLFAVAGLLMPYDRSFPVTAPHRRLQIDLTSIAGNAVVSAIQVDSQDDAKPPRYLTGLEAAAPACPGVGLTFFVATDTGHLFWCFAAGLWQSVGDVRNLGQPRLITLEECSGSGPTWDCAHLLRASIAMPDGSALAVYGAAMTVLSGPGVTWSSVK